MKTIHLLTTFFLLLTAFQLYAGNCKPMPSNPNIEMCIVITPKGELYSEETDPFEQNCSEEDFFADNSIFLGPNDFVFLENSTLTNTYNVSPFVKNQTYEIQVSLRYKYGLAFAGFHPYMQLQWRERAIGESFDTEGFINIPWVPETTNPNNVRCSHVFEFTPEDNTTNSSGDKWDFRGLRINLLSVDYSGTIDLNDNYSALIPFITTGPKSDEIDIRNTSPTPSIPYIVLHDPPGDQSFSSITANVDHCQTVGWSTQKANEIGVWAKAKVGTKISNSVLGLAEVETEVYASAQGSFSMSLKQNANGETERCLSTSSTFSTSSDNNAVSGERGDVFIGKSTLMSMGLAENITYECGYSPIIKKELVIAPTGIASEFAYTEDYIRKILIPDLDNILNNNSSNSAAYKTAFRQKEVWVQALDYNDDLKNNTITNSHIFSAGADQSYTETVSTTEIKTIESSIDIDMDLAIEAGVEVAGNGVSAGGNIRMRTETGFNSGNSSNTSNAISYTLSDGDRTTSGIGSDNFTVGVIHDGKHGTPAFVLLDGETSCPYEGGYQIDQPHLQYEDGSSSYFAQGEIGETLVVPIQICNQSNYDRNYHLKLDNFSNPNGLLINVSGTLLNSTDEGHLFSSTPANECLTQNLIIESPATSLTDFDGIELYLYACSENISQDGETIRSNIGLNVSFLEPAPAYNEACGAVNLPTDGSLQGPFNNSLASVENGEDSIAPPGTGCETQDGWCTDAPIIDNSVWFTFVAPSSGKVEVSTCGLADFDTQIAVYEVANCSDFSAFYLIGANDDGPTSCSTDYDSYLSLENLISGQTYYVLVDGYAASSGTFQIAVTDLMSTATENVNIANPLDVFPNPCSDKFTVHTTSNYEHLELSNLTGQVVLSQPLSSHNSNIEVSVSNLSSGIYFGVLRNPEQQEHFKIEVIKD